jgi:sialate O-acetylesterase
MNWRTILVGFLVLAAGWASVPASAEVKLPSIIGDNMVVQRDRTVPIWGWDVPGTKIGVTMGESKATATADADGRWLVELPAMAAGGPHTMTIQGTNTVTVQNVLVGEVWLCSGQSNMEWTVQRSANPEEEIAAGDHPAIRHIKIGRAPMDTPQDDVPADGWRVCSPETVANFTAVGYYFARHLNQELGVPVGLIGSNWGGTRIEPWTPPVGFQSVSALKDIADNLANLPAKTADGKVNHQSPLALYNGMIHPLLPMAIRGAIWYQGESNNGEGMLYHEKMKALIHGWRSVWNDPQMPFYYVQLAPFRYKVDPERLPGIWEAQLKTLSVPHTGMAVTVDIGDVTDIHPLNKQDVGKRLALWALAKTYGRTGLVYSGPLYKGLEIDGNRAIVSFDHVGGGLVSRDGQPLTDFQIAGEDGQFVAGHGRDRRRHGGRLCRIGRSPGRRPVRLAPGGGTEPVQPRGTAGVAVPDRLVVNNAGVEDDWSFPPARDGVHGVAFGGAVGLGRGMFAGGGPAASATANPQHSRPGPRRSDPGRRRGYHRDCLGCGPDRGGADPGDRYARDPARGTRLAVRPAVRPRGDGVRSGSLCDGRAGRAAARRNPGSLRPHAGLCVRQRQELFGLGFAGTLAVETVSVFGDNGFPREAAACLEAAAAAGPVPFEPPYLFRRRMREVAQQMRAEGRLPAKASGRD